MKLILLIVLIPFLLGAGEVKTVAGKADSSIASVMGKAGASVKTLLGKDYNDGDSVSALLSIDYESAISWDNTPFTLSSKAEDCDGYDADGDWCDAEETVKKNGSYAQGIRGNYYTQKNISASGELYGSFWWYTSASDWSQIRMRCMSSDGTVEVFSFRTSSQGNGEMWWYTNNEGTAQDPNYEPGSTTWVKIGFYYKKGATGTGDATLQVWANTDGAAFAAASRKISVTNTNSVSDDCVQVRLLGAQAGQVGYFDDVVFYSGAVPASWNE